MSAIATLAVIAGLILIAVLWPRRKAVPGECVWCHERQAEPGISLCLGCYVKSAL